MLFVGFVRLNGDLGVFEFVDEFLFVEPLLFNVSIAVQLGNPGSKVRADTCLVTFEQTP